MSERQRDITCKRGGKNRHPVIRENHTKREIDREREIKKERERYKEKERLPERE